MGIVSELVEISEELINECNSARACVWRTSAVAWQQGWHFRRRQIQSTITRQLPRYRSRRPTTHRDFLTHSMLSHGRTIWAEVSAIRFPTSI